jgi:predicted acyltransferase
MISWVVPSGLLCILGFAAHFSEFVPLNKNLYSSSYILLTGNSSSVRSSRLREVMCTSGLALLSGMGDG